jgi:hypothetical protein
MVSAFLFKFSSVSFWSVCDMLYIKKIVCELTP